jgi:hypothetical protein
MSSYTMTTSDMNNEYAYRLRTAPMYSSSDKSMMEKEKRAQRNAYKRFVNMAEETFQTLSPGFIQQIPFTGIGIEIREEKEDEQRQEEQQQEITTMTFSDIENTFLEYFNDPFSYSGALSLLAFLVFRYPQLAKPVWEELQSNATLSRKLSPTSHTTDATVYDEILRYVYFFNHSEQK